MKWQFASQVTINVLCLVLNDNVVKGIGRASLVFILHDVTRFTPLLARLVQ